MERRKATVLHLLVAGMGCPNCVNRVRNALLGARGVVDVEVDLRAGLATVWYRPGEMRLTELLAAVADAARRTHHSYLAVPVTSPG